MIAIFCGRLRDGERPTIYGDGTQTRDYIYVGDVVARASSPPASRGVDRRGQRRHRQRDVGARHRRGHAASSSPTPPRRFEPEFAQARLGEIERSCLDVAARPRGAGLRGPDDVAGRDARDARSDAVGALRHARPAVPASPALTPLADGAAGSWWLALLRFLATTAAVPTAAAGTATLAAFLPAAQAMRAFRNVHGGRAGLARGARGALLLGLTATDRDDGHVLVRYPAGQAGKRRAQAVGTTVAQPGDGLARCPRARRSAPPSPAAPGLLDARPAAHDVDRRSVGRCSSANASGSRPHASQMIARDLGDGQLVGGGDVEVLVQAPRRGHRGDDAVGDVVDVGQRARLGAVAEDRQRRALGASARHLRDDVGDHVRDARLVLGHLARAVGVERAADRVRAGRARRARPRRRPRR